MHDPELFRRVILLTPPPTGAPDAMPSSPEAS
jgi:hypothetical protein